MRVKLVALFLVSLGASCAIAVQQCEVDAPASGIAKAGRSALPSGPSPETLAGIQEAMSNVFESAEGLLDAQRAMKDASDSPIREAEMAAAEHTEKLGIGDDAGRSARTREPITKRDVLWFTVAFVVVRVLIAAALCCSAKARSLLVGSVVAYLLYISAAWCRWLYLTGLYLSSTGQ